MRAPRSQEWLVLFVSLALTGAAPLSAQGPGLTLSFTDAFPAPGESATLSALLDNSAGDVSGWFIGACHGADALDLLTVESGATTEVVNNGSPPDFQVVEIHPGGWTAGVVISSTGAAVLPVGNGYELHRATYRPIDLTLSADVCFCDTLGDPPVSTAVVVGGQGLVPELLCGTIAVDCSFPVLEVGIYSLPERQAFYDLTTGAGNFTVGAVIAQSPCYPISPAEIPTFSMGLQHDPALLQAMGVEPSPDLTPEPDIFVSGIFSDGWVCGAVADSFGVESFIFTPPQEAVIAHYETVPAALAGNPSGVTTPLIWSNDLGPPPVENCMSFGEFCVPAILIDGVVQLSPQDAIYRRGDCNGDGAVDLADAVGLLALLFSGASPPSCLAACDGNADGAIDLGDPIHLLGFLFTGGEPPPPPFPDCGSVAAGPLGCQASQLACP